MRGDILPTKMAQRPKLTVDCSNEVVEKIKQQQLRTGYKTLREFVLISLAERWPELKIDIAKELNPNIADLLSTPPDKSK